MMKLRSLLFLDLIVFVCPIGAALADDVPQFDTARLCQAEAASSQNKTGLENCTTDQQSARQQLVRDWNQFSVEVRAGCRAEATDIAGIQSYVELLTCLQVAKEASKLN